MWMTLNKYIKIKNLILWNRGEKMNKLQIKENELNQEILKINGKQYRRISEDVEQKPKLKHEFSEFYQRFKK